MSGVAPGMEKRCFLRGMVVGAQSQERLLSRARSLCVLPEEQFEYTERTFSRAKATKKQATVALKIREHRSGHCEIVYRGSIDKRNTAFLVQTVSVTTASDNAPKFVSSLGFSEVGVAVVKGTRFLHQNLVLTVSRLENPHDPEAAEADSEPFLVELSTGGETSAEAVSKEIVAFAQQLKPLVVLGTTLARR